MTALAALIATDDHAAARGGRSEAAVEQVQSRSADEPIIAIVSLHSQQITVYDAHGWILRAPVSSGQKGRETPAGIFSVIQKEAEHYSNLYASLGRASRSTVAPCRDIQPRMAASGCRSSSPSGCSTSPGWACG